MSALFIAAGYFLLYLVAGGTISSSPYTLCIVACFTWGLGAGGLDNACISTSVRNFPKERGAIVGLTKSMYGLASSMMTQFYVTFLNGDRTAFILLLCVFCGGVPLSLFPFVQLVPLAPAAVAAMSSEKAPAALEGGFVPAAAAATTSSADPGADAAALPHNENKVRLIRGILVSCFLAAVLLVVSCLRVVFTFGLIANLVVCSLLLLLVYAFHVILGRDTRGSAYPGKPGYAANYAALPAEGSSAGSLPSEQGNKPLAQASTLPLLTNEFGAGTEHDSSSGVVVGGSGLSSNGGQRSVNAGDEEECSRLEFPSQDGGAGPAFVPLADDSGASKVRGG